MRGILTYHSIDPSQSPISIDEAAFRSHVAWFATGAVPVVPLEQLIDPGCPDPAVALTFDDAFQNFADVAWPLLHARRLPVTLFVVSGAAGATNDWRGRPAPGIPTLGLMNWEALGRVASEGVTLGAHSRTHPDLRAVSGAALEEEIVGSADDIAQRTGHRPRAFAYPYGRLDDRVATSAARAFAICVTTELRELREDDRPDRLPRLDAFYLREPGQLEAWGQPRFRFRLSLRARLRGLREAVQRRQ